MPTLPRRWRFTRLSVAELVGAVVLAAVAAAIAWGGVRTFLGRLAVARAADTLHKNPAGGEAALHELLAAIDAHPREVRLLWLRGLALAERDARQAGAPDVLPAADAFDALVRRTAERSGDPEADRLRGFGLLGGAAMDLEWARRAVGTGDAAGREKAIAAAESKAERAAKLLPRRPEPRAYLGAAALERGDLERALALFEEAARAFETPAQGGLVTLYANDGEARLRRGDTAGAVLRFQQAALVSPPGTPLRARIVDRLADAIARRTCDPALASLDARKAAIAQARRAIVAVQKREGHRVFPLYGLETRHVLEVRAAIGAAEARAGLLADARRTLEAALREVPKDRGTPTTGDGLPIGVRMSRDLAAVLVALWREETRPQASRDLAYRAAEALKVAAEGTEPLSRRDAYELFFAAATLYIRAQSHEQAIKMLKRAEAIDASEFRLYRAFGIAYDRAERYQDAIPAYRSAIGKSADESATRPLAERVSVLSEYVR